MGFSHIWGHSVTKYVDDKMSQLGCKLSTYTEGMDH